MRRESDVTHRNWQGSGTVYRLEWGGRPWELHLGGTSPGLRPCGDEPRGAFLSLPAIAATGRCGAGALGDSSLLGVEAIRSRLEATYAPEGWGDLRVRASWSPCEKDAGMDLEVQVVASSVGALKSLEVYEETCINFDMRPPQREAFAWDIEARDRRTAGLSYDGREDDGFLADATSLPVPASGVPKARPQILPTPDPARARHYVEFVHPEDVSRRVVERTPRDGPEIWYVRRLRHALLGHDLEKGVVIRARLRGLWLASNDFERQVDESFRRFLAAPLPLGM